MDQEKLEPLHPEAWLDSCRQFRHSLQRQPANDHAPNIRRLFHLLRLAPAPLRPWFTPSVSEKLFEQMLAECELLASIALINPKLGIMLNRNIDDADIKLSLSHFSSKERVTIEHAELPVVVMAGISTLAISLINEN